MDGSLETEARVRLDQDGESFKISRSDLSLSADVRGIEESRLRELAEEAKRNCPVSKLLNAEIVSGDQGPAARVDGGKGRQSRATRGCLPCV